MRRSEPKLDARIIEGQRLMVICNACRYCEGYCAVFPAMERRLQFTPADIGLLANLCHNCAECYYACQYAPPHEFAVNVPKAFAEIRAQCYEQHAWPRRVQAPFWAALAAGLAVAFALAAGGVTGGARVNFYAVVSHATMVRVFGGLSMLIAAVWLAGFVRFWTSTGAMLAEFFRPEALLAGLRDAFTLKNLASGGAGCTYPNERHSQARRWFHHFTFYGFLLCFASTTVAAIYHFSGRIAPYPYLSAPVVLGTLGGIGLLIGPAGLYALKRRRDPAIADPQQDSPDVSLIALLFLTSFTGLLLLVLRETAAMPVLLAIHLSIVLALFLTLPYGKFVHGIYRTAALVRSALEASRGEHKGRDQAH
jgi:citrate/tricarballylate utilization protein